MSPYDGNPEPTEPTMRDFEDPVFCSEHEGWGESSTKWKVCKGCLEEEYYPCEWDGCDNYQRTVDATDPAKELCNGHYKTEIAAHTCSECKKVVTLFNMMFTHKNRCSDCEDKAKTCALCGGEMKWCDGCRMYSSRCCEEYGTCMCS
jgi:hypothetical protein